MCVCVCRRVYTVYIYVSACVCVLIRDKVTEWLEGYGAGPVPGNGSCYGTMNKSCAHNN